MGEILHFMELEGYKRLKEMENANLRLHKKIEVMQQKLDTEIILRQLYEQLSKKRLQTIMELQERIGNDEDETGCDEDGGGRCEENKTITIDTEGDRTE